MKRLKIAILYLLLSILDPRSSILDLLFNLHPRPNTPEFADQQHRLRKLMCRRALHHSHRVQDRLTDIFNRPFFGDTSYRSGRLHRLADIRITAER